MNPYIPLFALATIWTVFATIQDLKTREVSNWLNFSLIAFALAYRAFYSASTNNLSFFLYGLAGLAIFTALGHIFYYAKVFAGGDAKLLIGFGIILPYQNPSNLISLPLLLIFFLFLAGAIWSMIYSIKVVLRNKKTFAKEWKKIPKNSKTITLLSLLAALISAIVGTQKPFALVLTIAFITPLIWLYTRTLEKCMVSLTPPEKLTEGDWLEKEIKVAGKTIKKSVHGLSYKEIQLLRKHKKPALIKNGIPFVPAFLITIIFMALVFLTSKLNLPFPFSLVG